jgi:hypothetical protein
MSQYANESTTLPRGFRFHHKEGIPQTPEPTMMVDEEIQPPCAPRPARLRVRRRNHTSLQAPTDQFLASVDAADIPIPTIEVNHSSLPSRLLPPVNTFDADLDMTDLQASVPGKSFLQLPHQPYGRMGALPKTPEPESLSELESSRPCWALGSRWITPNEEHYTRSSSAMSTASECSDDSFYSGSRRSHRSRSEDGSCTSPDSDVDDPFQFPSLSKASTKSNSIRLQAPADFSPLNHGSKSKTRKDAPWTKPMSRHLWDTYVLYLQDPTVTPFRAGGVPPEGVCHRVAREAKRSWKGPQQSTHLSLRKTTAFSQISDKSGSLTPTAESSHQIYAQWPHSSGATRNHLRQLCRKESNAVQRHRHLQTRSTTPFTKASLHGSSQSSGPRPSMFSTKDIAISLATSTSVTMQPDGPLASLALQDSDPTPTPTKNSSPSSAQPLSGVYSVEPQALAFNLDNRQSHRLGSPFIARTYGPSSSQNRRTPSPARNRSETSAPRLRSPVRFSNHKSLNTTQKRRAQTSLDENEATSSYTLTRPSVLDQKLFGTPLGHSRRRVRSRGFSLGDEAFRQGLSGAFRRPPPEFNLGGKVGIPANGPSGVLSAISTNSRVTPSLLPATSNEPPRLGSPFTEAGPSQTFPRRQFQDSQATIRRGAYATMHQSRHSINTFDFGPSQEQTKLEQLDSRLREIREREAAARR